jgi:tetratricopeptide (TPR) repeat protein
MLKCWLFNICFLVALIAQAQQGLPDTLRQQLSGVVQDSNYVNTLNKAAFEYLRTHPSVSRSIASHALAVSTRIKYIPGYARALTVMGNTYWYEGVYEFAQNYYLLAARQYQSIQDSVGLGETFNNIGEVYKRMNDFDKSLEYLTNAGKMIGSDSAKQGLILYNLGELYIRHNQLGVAKKYIDQSYETAIRTKNKRLIAFNYGGLAAIRSKEKNFESALAYYFDAAAIWKETNEIRSLIQTYQDIASIYLFGKNFRKSQQYLDYAITLAQEIKVPDLQLQNYLRYSKLDSLRGNFGSALLYLTKHNALKDSVYNILKAEQIARLQTIYEIDNRDLENEQLRTEQKLINSQIAYQRIILVAISLGLMLAGILAWFLYRQRKKILFQKNAIESQAKALLHLNRELQELNKSLERRIDERTNQLQLQNKRITEYTFINAHKLRAPVASILGLINLLQQSDLKERDVILTHLKTCSEQLDLIIHEVSRNLEEAIVNEGKRRR